MNFYQYLDQQSQEDRRAFIVHGEAGCGKTRFARRLAEGRPGLFYLDLLAHALAAPAWPAVNELDPRRLQSLLLGLASPPGATAVLVDHADFLFNTWTAAEKQRLIDWLRLSLRSPGVTDKTFVFVIQTDGVLSAAGLENSKRLSRALHLSEFDAL